MGLSKTNIPPNLLTDIRELLATARGQQCHGANLLASRAVDCGG
jgi:hypothetical protein